MVRDCVGYGRARPKGVWPNGARLAVNVVVNYEEGSERSFAMGDADQESMTEWGAYPFPGSIRNLAMESMYEYGSRVGIWRVLDALAQHELKATFFACAVAFEQNPAVAKEVVAAGHEVCSHGYRWEEVFRLSREEEAKHIRLALDSFEKTCGKRPVGWYCRYGPSVHTRELLVENGSFLYDSDAYNDDVPYMVRVGGQKHLVVPYTCDINDLRFWIAPGFIQSDDFYWYLCESLDVLLNEAEGGLRMMSIGLHPRMIGRPGRISSLSRFFDYAIKKKGVWFATREEIARAWLQRGEADAA